MRKYFLAFCLALGVLTASASFLEGDSIRWECGITADFSDGPYNPFLFSANRYGLSSVKPNNGVVTLGAYRDMDTKQTFSWGAGVEVGVPWNYTSSIVVQQLYGEARYRCLNLMIGSKNISGPLSDPALASGNLIHSSNARPIPQIKAGIFDYASIWGTQGWLAAKGYVAYGAFTDSQWQKSWEEPIGGHYNKNVLYCGRGLWLRNGNPEKFPLTFEAGIEMVTQFGGTSYNYEYANSGKIIHMPHNFKAFVKAFIPEKGGASTIWSEQANVQGNMLGAWNFALTWAAPGSDWSVKAYYQHMFEDHSMLYIDYPWKDALYGVEASLPPNRWISKVVYEYLYTKDQSGSVNWTVTPEVPGHAAGADNYYNHNLYVGWQHWGQGIGNSLILAPIYNRPHALEFHANRVVAHHLGVSGNPTSQIGWRLIADYLKTWGGYNHPFTEVKDMFNILAEVSWKPECKLLKGWQGSVGLSMDRGDLIGHNYGVQFSISRSGFFKF